MVIMSVPGDKIMNRNSRSLCISNPGSSFISGCTLALVGVMIFLAASKAAGETATYTYDAIGRLTRVQYTSGAVITYVYDNKGNRLMKSLSRAGESTNAPPNQASSPVPVNGATVGSSLTLQWSGSDPDPGDRLFYTAYLGTAPASMYRIWSGTSSSLTPGQLQPQTTYYWQIVSKDSHNAETSGPIWSFTTGSSIVNPYQFILNVGLVGTGSGTITSSPAGIACTGLSGDACTAEFGQGGTVTLSEVTSFGSKFTGWSDKTCSTGSDCAVTMDADKTVSAAFERIPPIRISFPDMPGFETFFDTLTIALGALQSLPYLTNLQTQDRQYVENADFVNTQDVKWTGGYAADFGGVTGMTRLKGVMTIGTGSVVIKNVVIE
jgi:YD repeat-containing protein